MRELLATDAVFHSPVVHTPQRGKALTHEASRESYDLFLLDWQVPDLSGEEVLRWIRSHVAAPVPVMVTCSRVLRRTTDSWCPTHSAPAATSTETSVAANASGSSIVSTSP